MVDPENSARGPWSHSVQTEELPKSAQGKARNRTAEKTTANTADSRLREDVAVMTEIARRPVAPMTLGFSSVRNTSQHTKATEKAGLIGTVPSLILLMRVAIRTRLSSCIELKFPTITSRTRGSNAAEYAIENRRQENIPDDGDTIPTVSTVAIVNPRI
jgi:hypothetical protein